MLNFLLCLLLVVLVISFIVITFGAIVMIFECEDIVRAWMLKKLNRDKEDT